MNVFQFVTCLFTFFREFVGGTILNVLTFMVDIRILYITVISKAALKIYSRFGIERVKPLSLFSVNLVIRVIFNWSATTCTAWVFSQGTDLFSLGSDNSQHNSLVPMNQIIPIFFGQISKKYGFFLSCIILVLSLCVPQDENGWESLVSKWTAIESCIKYCIT